MGNLFRCGSGKVNIDEWTFVKSINGSQVSGNGSPTQYTLTKDSLIVVIRLNTSSVDNAKKYCTLASWSGGKVTKLASEGAGSGGYYIATTVYLCEPTGESMTITNESSTVYTLIYEKKK